MGLIIHRVVITTEIEDDGKPITYWQWDHDYDIPTKTQMIGMLEHCKLGMFHLEPDDDYFEVDNGPAEL